MTDQLRERKQVSLLKRAPLFAVLGCVALGAAVLVAGAAKLVVPALNYRLTAGVVALVLFGWLASLLRQYAAETN